MRNKKNQTDTKAAEQKALEKHVDAMMDIKQQGEPSAGSVTTVSAPTAPQLSAKLRKQAGLPDAPSKPLHIKKLDDLADKVDEAPAQAEVPEAAETADTPDNEPPQENLDEQSVSLDDAQTDKAVDDITAYEGDVMLAVADSTAEARNQEAAAAERPDHPLLSTIFWAIIIFLVFLIVILGALFALGDNLTQKLGL